jgi:hypothetical protein
LVNVYNFRGKIICIIYITNTNSVGFLATHKRYYHIKV